MSVDSTAMLATLQRQRDAMAGLNTAGFVSGYRGSPLGGYDQALWAAKKHLAAHNVVFQPGVNEELAATAEEMGGRAAELEALTGFFQLEDASAATSGASRAARR